MLNSLLLNRFPTFTKNIVTKILKSNFTIPTIIATIFFTLFSWYAFFLYNNFISTAYDLGIFDQAIRQYALFKEPLVAIKGLNFNILGDHFHPIIITLTPLYWIWADPRMLGIVTALLLVIPIFPIYFFAKKRFGTLFSTIISIVYSLWWTNISLLNSGFHEIVFAAPIIAFIIWALDIKRYPIVITMSLILLLVREDMGITVVMVAIILAIQKKYKLAIFLGLTGIITFLLVTKLFIPHFSTQQKFAYWEYTALGTTMSATILFMLTNPLETLSMMFNQPQKRLLWIATFLPTGLLAFGSSYLLLALPIFFSKIFNDRENLWGIYYQYNVIFGAIIIMASIDTLSRITPFFQKNISKKIVVSFCILSLASTYYFSYPQIIDKITKQQDLISFTTATALIPPHTCVEASEELSIRLLKNNYVAPPGKMGDLANWAIFDLSKEEITGPEVPNAISNQARHQILLESGFETIFSQNNIVVLHNPKKTIETICKTYTQR